jgi:hypothetical protein
MLPGSTRINLIDQVPNSLAPISTITEDGVIYLKGAVLHNSTQNQVNVKLYSVAPDGGLPGVASVLNQLLDINIPARDTFCLDLSYPIVLNEINSTLQGVASAGNAVSIIFLGIFLPRTVITAEVPASLMEFLSMPPGAIGDRAALIESTASVVRALPTVYIPWQDEGNVALLLYMDGADGGTTFLDSSPSIRLLTRNGAAVLSSTVSKFGGTSMAVNGGNISVSPSIALSGQFTIEAWAQHSGNGTLLGSSSIGNNQLFRVDGSSLYSYLNSGYTTYISTASLPTGQLNHLRMTRDASNVIRVFINGELMTEDGPNAVTGSTISITNIGSVYTTWSGYIDELLIIDGECASVSSFPVPTTQYTSPVIPDAPRPSLVNVSALFDFDGTEGSTTFTDSSLNGLTATGFGNAQITTSGQKYGTGCLLLDGSGDYVEVPGSELLSFPGQFCVEAWILRSASASLQTVLELGTYLNGIMIRPGLATDNFYVNGNNIAAGSATNAVVNGNWHHLAVTRDESNLVRVFVDGLQRGSLTVAGVVNSTSSGLRIGESRHTSNQFWNGRIDGFRIVKGEPVYTSNFIPSAPLNIVPPSSADIPSSQSIITSRPVLQIVETAPWSDPTNVSLLLHMDGTNGSTTFTDSSLTGRTISRFGDAQISTARSQFGGASGLFDGSGDYLSAANSADFHLVDGSPFTISLWVYNEVTVAEARYLLRHRHTGSYFGGGWVLARSGSGGNYFFQFGTGSGEVMPATVGGSPAAVNNTWEHVAVTYDGTTYRVFQGGTLVRSLESALTGIAGNLALEVGRDASNSDRDWDGSIDEVLILKGECLWTADFTPPAIPYKAPMNQIIPASYSQSSLYGFNQPATAAGMANGRIDDSTQTGTNSEAEAWLEMDFGYQRSFNHVVVGPHTSALAGGWGNNTYTNNSIVRASNDRINWDTLVADSGIFAGGIKSFAVPGASYRYVRIVRLNNYLAISEFYAL